MSGSIYDNWWIESPVPGLRFKVTVTTDERTDPYRDGLFPPDGETENPDAAYTAENIAAWKADLWEFVNVDVTPVFKGVTIGECRASLGGTHSGYMESGGDRIGREELAEYPVKELVEEAMANLRTPKLSVEIMSERQAAESHDNRADQLQMLRATLRSR